MADILIATDIDGTLTDRLHEIPKETLSYLAELSAKGAELLFVTGRPFQRGHQHLQEVPFPYYLAVYNGSLIFRMPEKEIVYRNYLESVLVEQIALLCSDYPTDVVIYGGYEHEELCYFRPHHFSKELLAFLHTRVAHLNEKWIQVATFDDVPIRAFPSVKCFGTRSDLEQLTKQLEYLALSTPVITDPVNRLYSVAQITKHGVNKGAAIESIKRLNPKKNYLTIACGDDFNDYEMLLGADVAVVMETAPKELLAIADIIVPSSRIIEGINKAWTRLYKS